MAELREAAVRTREEMSAMEPRGRVDAALAQAAEERLAAQHLRAQLEHSKLRCSAAEAEADRLANAAKDLVPLSELDTTLARLKEERDAAAYLREEANLARTEANQLKEELATLRTALDRAEADRGCAEAEAEALRAEVEQGKAQILLMAGHTVELREGIELMKQKLDDKSWALEEADRLKQEILSRAEEGAAHREEVERKKVELSIQRGDLIKWQETAESLQQQLKLQAEAEVRKALYEELERLKEQLLNQEKEGVVLREEALRLRKQASVYAEEVVRLQEQERRSTAQVAAAQEIAEGSRKEAERLQEEVRALTQEAKDAMGREQLLRQDAERARQRIQMMAEEGVQVREEAERQRQQGRAQAEEAAMLREEVERLRQQVRRQAEEGVVLREALEELNAVALRPASEQQCSHTDNCGLSAVAGSSNEAHRERGARPTEADDAGDFKLEAPRLMAELELLRAELAKEAHLRRREADEAEASRLQDANEILRLRTALDEAEAAAAAATRGAATAAEGGSELLEAVAAENLRCRAETARLREECAGWAARESELEARLAEAEERAGALAARHARAQGQLERAAERVRELELRQADTVPGEQLRHAEEAARQAAAEAARLKQRNSELAARIYELAAEAQGQWLRPASSSPPPPSPDLGASTPHRTPSVSQWPKDIPNRGSGPADYGNGVTDIPRRSSDLGSSPATPRNGDNIRNAAAAAAVKAGSPNGGSGGGGSGFVTLEQWQARASGRGYVAPSFGAAPRFQNGLPAHLQGLASAWPLAAGGTLPLPPPVYSDSPRWLPPPSAAPPLRRAQAASPASRPSLEAQSAPPAMSSLLPGWTEAPVEEAPSLPAGSPSRGDTSGRAGQSNYETLLSVVAQYDLLRSGAGSMQSM